MNKSNDINIRVPSIVAMYEAAADMSAKFSENDAELRKDMQYIADEENIGGDFAKSHAEVIAKVCKAVDGLSIRYKNLNAWFEAYASKYQDISDRMVKTGTSASDSIQGKVDSLTK